MRIAVDWDGTLAIQAGRAYEDVTTPFQLMPGAREALEGLKRAGHVVIIYSARSNRALIENPELDPLVRAGIARPWSPGRMALHQARYRQMVDFCETELAGLFDVIDDGRQGKPCADLFIDDRAIRFGYGADAMQWPEISHIYGYPAKPLGPQSPMPTGQALLDAHVNKLDLRLNGMIGDLIGILRDELAAHGIAFLPNFYLGDGDFWTANRATSINVPWFLAAAETWLLANQQEATRYTPEEVMRTLRHEAGHAVNYAFRLWERPGWNDLFGDFRAPYPPPPDWKPSPGRRAEFVRYLDGIVAPDYGQRHPDEDFAETFAAWLDPESHWRSRWQGRALEKLQHIDAAVPEMAAPPVGVPLGKRIAYTSIKGTVRAVLGL